MEQVKELKPSAFHIALWKYRGEKDSLIPLLQAAQAHYSYVPESAIHSISSVTGIPSSEIFGVVTFYRQFRLTPPGKHLIRVCDGTACHVNSSTMIINAMKDILEIEPDETTGDGLFTFQTVACLGCCSLAPVMTIDNETYGRLNPSKIEKILEKYRQ
ncbi:MAG: NADH-quinone oxidoreductase subunit NuoE [Vulcanimicrobiota bacterium]